MRRSICISEPNIALAGQIRTWKFSYTPSTTLPAGTKLKFDMMMATRPSDWEIPSSSLEAGENMIWLQLPNGEQIESDEIYLPNQYAPSFEFILPEEIKGGEVIEFYMGSPGSDPAKGTQAQTTTQKRHPFNLYVDPKGKGDYKDPEVFTIDIRGNVLENIKIFTPSLVSKNRRFDIVVRFEDAYGNLTSNAPEGTLIQLTYEHLRENLNWKLFVPETGFIVLPNLYFNEPGVYRIQLKSSASDQFYYSSPIKCFMENDFSVFWGTLHGESQSVDAGSNAENYMRHIRDEVGSQFVGTSPFESLAETPNEVWKAICANVQEYNEENRFTTMLGLSWLGDEGEGLRQLIYWKDNKPMMRKKDSKYTNLKKIYKIHSQKEVLGIPKFTMGKGLETDFSDYNPDYERVVEIYNAWGCSECTKEEGNLRPIDSPSGEGIVENASGSIRKALAKNMRFGFVAGGLDDRGVYAPLFESDQKQYSPGLTAIIAIEQTRETLMQALYNRSCYATTGAKIVLGFAIAGSQMGSELSTQNKPGLAYNRHITGFICGTDNIVDVSFICNGRVIHQLTPHQINVEFEYDHFQQLSEITIDSPDERPPFAYYYLRVIQEDGHIAWSSPIWVDLSSSVSAPIRKPKGKSVKK